MSHVDSIVQQFIIQSGNSGWKIRKVGEIVRPKIRRQALIIDLIPLSVVLIRPLRNSMRAPQLPSKTHSWHETSSQNDPNLVITYYSCVPV